MSWVAVAVALVLVGLVLIIAEAFIPSGGLLTVMSVVSTGAGVVVGFTRVGAAFGGILVTCALLLGPAAFLYGLSRLPTTRIGRRFILSGPQPDRPAPATAEPDYEPLLGRKGRALTLLRPAGMAEFDGRRYDVVTEGALVPKGARVKVMAIEGNRIVVRPVNGEEEGEA